jgi:DNA-binding transcriptional MocR family regulator
MREVLAMADDECRALWNDLRLGYTESLGLPQLRAQVAGMYEGATADDVVVGAPEELIFVAMNALLRPGDRVVCTYPGYQSLFEIARAIGCVVDLKPREKDGWRFDVDDLSAFRPRTKLVVQLPTTRRARGRRALGLRCRRGRCRGGRPAFGRCTAFSSGTPIGCRRAASCARTR